MPFWIQSLKNRHGYVPSPLKNKTELSIAHTKIPLPFQKGINSLMIRNSTTQLFTRWHIQPDIQKDWQENLVPSEALNTLAKN